jgi:hypothetical protein
MKSLALFLFMIALASYSLQAQDVVVYSHHENPYKSSTKTSDEKKESQLVKPSKDKHNQIPLHATPVGNFLNVSHKLPKNSSYQIYDDKGVQFLVGRMTVNGVIPVKSLSKGTYKLHLND